MSDSKVQIKLKNIKTATLMILGLFILLRYVKSPYLEDYMLEISLSFMVLVLVLFIYRVFLEVKHGLFEPKKYYLFAFFILITIIYGLFSWLKL